MNSEKFGDSYDIVKQCFLQWLNAYGRWSVHPMFTDEHPMLYAVDYCRFLNVSSVFTKTITETKRSYWLEPAYRCQHHLFLDPDTGLPWHTPKKSKLDRFLLLSELECIAKARPNQLTLVFDQSISRAKGAKPKKEQIKEKLEWLKCRKVHGVVYASHAHFVLVSCDQEILRCAKSTLGNSSRLPSGRFVELEQAVEE